MQLANKNQKSNKSQRRVEVNLAVNLSKKNASLKCQIIGCPTLHWHDAFLGGGAGLIGKRSPFAQAAIYGLDVGHDNVSKQTRVQRTPCCCHHCPWLTLSCLCH
jgi:hypothetical protein